MGDYIQEIRKLVGHTPVLIVGCGVILENEKGEILLQKRTDDGTWGTPGGCLNQHEKLTEAAAREVYEETGLTVRDLSLYGLYSGVTLNYPNGDVCFGVLSVFITDKYEGKLLEGNDLTETGESSELGFFSRDALPRPISPSCQPFIDKWCAGNRSLTVD